MGVENCTALDWLSWLGGGGGWFPLVWIVNAWVQVLTAPSVSVAVKLTEPETGPAEAATPVTVAVTPSELISTVALESLKV